MNTQSTAAERALALNTLLDHYARAVAWMRKLQDQFQNSATCVSSRELEDAEKEVDELTALHLQATAHLPKLF